MSNPGTDGFDRVIADLERLCAAKMPRGHGFRIALDDPDIFLVGLVTLQWAALYEFVQTMIIVMKDNPKVPEALKAYKPDQRQESNITFLRKLGAAAYADEREGVAEAFDRNIAHIFTFKGDRDKLAHGMFAVNENVGFEGVRGSYKNKRFELSRKRLLNVANGIGRCNSVLLEFESWANAPKMLRSLKAFRETQAQQGPAQPSQ